jgi:hypothetical protein
MKCNLSSADLASLETPEKYKAFFIFQYKEQDEWLKPTLERYFGERTWRLFNAGEEGGTGTKFCNVCRYALASDFGIASCTPLNNNVYQEIGLMQGLQKPVLYLVNPNHKLPNDKLPFDIDDQIYIKHDNEESLKNGLNNKVGLLIDKLQLISGYESAQKDMVKSKLDLLADEAKALLKKIVLEGPFQISGQKFLNLVADTYKTDTKYFRELEKHMFVVEQFESWGTRKGSSFGLHEPYRKHLEKLLWEKNQTQNLTQGKLFE